MKLWEGRFSAGAHSRIMDEFNDSLPVDRYLIEEDLDTNRAWVATLHHAGLITDDEKSRICKGLDDIRNDYRKNGLSILPDDEDIHTAIEHLLIDKTGESAKKIHTGRSRNDQVCCDFRLYVKKSCTLLHDTLTLLQRALVTRAERDREIISAGYTHLQQAQPILLAHYWLSFFFALQREKERIRNAFVHADISPLGAGALAGSGFDLDRRFCAKLLGFSRISENSIDAVSSRDFALELCASLSSLAIVLSRYAEDLIIWSSREFGLIELSDAWSTGSSMMPQKKNPDSLELMRGKSARFIANHTRLATTLKGIGLAYYKDLQEDKEPVFDSVSQMQRMLGVFTGVIDTLQVRGTRVRNNLDSYMLATDIADYLVDKGIRFRESHHISGRIVSYCLDNDCPLTSLSLSQLRKFSSAFEEDIATVLQWDHAISHRDVAGGTGHKSVDAQLEKARSLCNEDIDHDDVAK